MFLAGAVNEKEARKMAEKLHKQFAHPTPEKLIALLKNANASTELLEREIKLVSEKCEVCIKFKRNPPRPVVSLPLASKFNDTIAIDLKSYERKYFLVAVDLLTRFCGAIVLCNKMSATVIKGLLMSWITHFGAPTKILSDNGREFNSEDFQTFAESFNIKLLNTAAESPWSNGVCEKLNGVLGKSVSKIREDSGCDVETALAWAVSARNALSNFSGFSPNQLVFGFNPALPTSFESELPALEKAEGSEIVVKNLSALHAARREFVRIESCERIRRALRSNVRKTNLGSISNGDEVFYKRNNSDRWHGPGIVVGRDGKQVLVRHGGTLHRVHTCRLSRRPAGDADEPTGSTDSQVLGETEPDELLPPAGEDREEEVESDTASLDDGDGDPGEEPRSADGVDDMADGSGPVESDESSTAAEASVDVVSESDIPMACDSTTVAGVRSWKRGERFQGRDADNGEIISGRILGRAGKSTGVHKHCYNIEDSRGWTGWYDLSTLQELQVVPDAAEMLVLHCNDAVTRAKEKEMENWRANDVYDEVPDEGQSTISTRWVISERIKEGVAVTKARLVARGFEEDTSALRKDSPTCAKESVRVLLSIASSKSWICHVVDVKAAYLQGKKIEREVYLKPPPDLDNGTVWKLKKTVYGLCDAARAWYLRVKSQMSDLEVVMCRFDNSLFYAYHQEQLVGVICIYVDDFLWAGTEWFDKMVVEKLKQAFLIGSSGSVTFRYVGLKVTSSEDGISVDQGQYVASLQPIKMNRPRSYQRDNGLSDSEKDSYRSLIGQLNWISTNTRPDIAYDVCELSSAFNHATVSDLIKLNKLVGRIQADSFGLHFPRLYDLENCELEVYTDASFASLRDGGSQGALLVFLKDREGKRSLLLWQTRRLKRVVKSTLAAETMALLEGAEAGVYMAQVLKEVLRLDSMTVLCVTDNKSLCDALKSTKQVDDKRLRIDIAVLVDMIQRNDISEVSWTDSRSQLADCLTKREVSTERLRSAITK